MWLFEAVGFDTTVMSKRQEARKERLLKTPAFSSTFHIYTPVFPTEYIWRGTVCKTTWNIFFSTLCRCLQHSRCTDHTGCLLLKCRRIWRYFKGTFYTSICSLSYIKSIIMRSRMWGQSLDFVQSSAYMCNFPENWSSAYFFIYWNYWNKSNVW